MLNRRIATAVLTTLATCAASRAEIPFESYDLSRFAKNWIVTLSPSAGVVTIERGTQSTVVAAANGNGLFGHHLVIVDDAQGDGVRDLLVAEPWGQVAGRGLGAVHARCGSAGSQRWVWYVPTGGVLDPWIRSIPDHDSDGVMEVLVERRQGSLRYTTLLSGSNGFPLTEWIGDVTTLAARAWSGERLWRKGDLTWDGETNEDDVGPFTTAWMGQEQEADLDQDFQLTTDDVAEMATLVSVVSVPITVATVEPISIQFGDAQAADSTPPVCAPGNPAGASVGSPWGELPDAGLTPDCIRACAECYDALLELHPDKVQLVAACRAAAICPPAKLICLLKLAKLIKDFSEMPGDCGTCRTCAWPPRVEPVGWPGGKLHPGPVTLCGSSWKPYDSTPNEWVHKDSPNKEGIVNCRFGCVEAFYTNRANAEARAAEAMARCMARPSAPGTDPAKKIESCEAERRRLRCLYEGDAHRVFASCWDACDPNQPDEGWPAGLPVPPTSPRKQLEWIPL